MRNLTKWALGSLLVCSGVLAASQTTTVSQSVNRSVSEWVSSKAAMQATLHSEALTELEKSVSTTQFDSANRMHALRLKRIMFYVTQARAYEQQNWQYNRDDAVQRASNILRHHQMKTGQGSYVL
jgi:hypothetical protein